MGCDRIFKLEELRFTSQHRPLSTGSGPAFIKGSQPSAVWAGGTRARCRVGHSHPGSLGWVSPGGDPGVGGAGGLNESSVVF